MSDPFTRELTLIVDDMTSLKKRAAMLASYAREQIAKTTIENSSAIGRMVPKPKVTVDGRRNAPLGSVRADGTIVAQFNNETNAVRWVLRELEQISPQLTGAYQDSHTVFADGAEIRVGSAGEIPEAREYIIASDLPYARKLDPQNSLPARSKQAPQGVYAAIAAVAAKRFDGEAVIRFTFREVPMAKGGWHRNPAIIVRPGQRNIEL